MCIKIITFRKIKQCFVEYKIIKLVVTKSGNIQERNVLFEKCQKITGN